MHCESARDALLERLDRPLDGPGTRALEAHLEGCGDCRALAADLADLGAQARVWHELSPPPWNPAAGLPVEGPAAAGDDWRAAVATWFPTLASAAALLLALTVFLRSAAGPTAELPEHTGSAETAGQVVEQLLAATRAERQQELEALTTLIKAEMDRRSLETEQSLKYVISHQIQSQRQLESIRSRLQPAAPATAEQL